MHALPYSSRNKGTPGRYRDVMGISADETVHEELVQIDQEGIKNIFSLPHHPTQPPSFLDGQNMDIWLAGKSGPWAAN